MSDSADRADGGTSRTLLPVHGGLGPAVRGRRPVIRRRRGGALLAITEAGRDALHRDMAQRDAWLTRALDDLTDAEVELVRIAAELLDGLAERPDDPLVVTAGTARSA
ncbi:hypothetical protein [Frankia sp. AgKG'84/4]|uniref:hypothetical protein n=1 Tax=Frankia sp. AgKG'84/4 TaxID=573490 RepID=UPI00202A1E47|nr:hypothetical protein [Frankia sp. AgKG'84/4]MCL9796994.1 hypothetical protein [Frankia sp. AgKG'84/4]